MSYHVGFIVGTLAIREVVRADSIAHALWQVRARWVAPRIGYVVKRPEGG